MKKLLTPSPTEATEIIPASVDAVVLEAEKTPPLSDFTDYIDELGILYQQYLGHGQAFLLTTIQIGECVTKILKTMPKLSASKKPVTPKALWTQWAKGRNVPFGWVQVLRYKKIYENKDQLIEKLRGLSINPTVEKCYRLLGGPDPVETTAKTPKPAPKMAGVRLPVSMEPLQKRQNELAAEIQKAQEEIAAAKELIEAKQRLADAYEFVERFIEREDVVERRPPTSRADYLLPFSLVSKESKEVKRYYLTIQAYRDFGRFHGDRTAECYRKWLSAKYATEPDKLLQKLQDFLFNPKEGMGDEAEEFGKYVETMKATAMKNKDAHRTGRLKRDSELRDAVYDFKKKWREEHPVSA